MSTGSATSADFDSWVARAREVRIEEELSRRGIKLAGRNGKFAGPCPVCGGDDRFAINIKKQLFHCRKCGGKGGGAIDLVMFLGGVNFLAAVEILIGYRPEPVVAKAVENTEAATTTEQDDAERHRTAALAVVTAPANPRHARRALSPVTRDHMPTTADARVSAAERRLLAEHDRGLCAAQRDRAGRARCAAHRPQYSRHATPS
jgi:phage/plasmid primase-like uncharacterized protein